MELSRTLNITLQGSPSQLLVNAGGGTHFGSGVTNNTLFLGKTKDVVALTLFLSLGICMVVWSLYGLGLRSGSGLLYLVCEGLVWLTGCRLWGSAGLWPTIRILHPFHYLHVTVFIEQLQAIYTLNTPSIVSCGVVFCRDSAILMAGLPPRCFAGAPTLHPGLSTAPDHCDWFKEIQT